MKALNRKEALVNAKANGTLDSFKPLTRDEAFTKKALGLGGGASSWNDLKDKPFGEEMGEVVIFDEQSIKLFDGEPFDSFPITLELDKEYIVNLNGETYNLIAYAYESRARVGRDDGLLVAVGGGNVPFLLLWKERTGRSLLSVYGENGELTTDTSCTLGVSVVDETVKTLDEKYLPDSVKGSFNIHLSILETDEGMSFSVDKTYEEIVNAINNEIRPVIVLKSAVGAMFYPYNSHSGADILIFTRFYTNGSKFKQEGWRITANNIVTVIEQDICTLPE